MRKLLEVLKGALSNSKVKVALLALAGALVEYFTGAVSGLLGLLGA